MAGIDEELVTMSCENENILADEHSDQNIRVTEKDLGQPIEDDTVIQLTDGSGAFATLTVFHGLHCVERLHHYLYPEYYYHSFSEEDKLLLKYHTGRCPQRFDGRFLRRHLLTNNYQNIVWIG